MDLKYEFYIAGTPERVWNALISPEDTKKYFAGSVIKSTFKIGESLAYVGPGNDGDETVHVYGTLLEFEPNQIISFTHNVGQSYVKDGISHESRITFSLDPVGACTKLTLIQDNWHKDDPSYANTDAAWWMILSNIKTVIETGNSLDLG